MCHLPIRFGTHGQASTPKRPIQAEIGPPKLGSVLISTLRWLGGRHWPTKRQALRRNGRLPEIGSEVRTAIFAEQGLDLEHLDLDLLYFFQNVHLASVD